MNIPYMEMWQTTLNRGQSWKSGEQKMASRAEDWYKQARRDL